MWGVAGGEDGGGEAGEDGGEAGPVARSPSPSTVKRIFRRRSSERWKMGGPEMGWKTSNGDSFFTTSVISTYACIVET